MAQARRQLLSIQRSLYDKAFAEAHAFVDPSQRAILRYSEKFEATLPDRFSMLTADQYYQKLQFARLILYGDFHTLKQCQRGLLRICRDIISSRPKSKIAFALECFRAKDQEHLEAYLANTISESEFLQTIHYQDTWGFPWAHYRMILEYAAEFQIPVFGINTDNGGIDSLAVRDEFASQTLVSLLDKLPGHQIFCLVGEYHLADSHLPKVLQRTLKKQGRTDQFVRTLTNVDRYYFLLSHEAEETSTQYLQLRNDLFCIMNCPPWLKWQSYTVHEETRAMGATLLPDEFDEDDPDGDWQEYTEHTFDFDHQIHQFLQSLTSFLEIPIPKEKLFSCNVFSGTESDAIETFLSADGNSSSAEIDRIVERAVLDGMYYSPDRKTILLTNFSPNSMAEATGQFLHHECSGFVSGTGANFHDFYQRIVKSTLGMFTSLIFNPKRKYMDIASCANYLRNNRNRRLIGPAKWKRATASAIVSHDAWIRERLTIKTSPPPRVRKQFYLTDLATNYDLSRRIGHILGHHLYLEMKANHIQPKTIRGYFYRNFADDLEAWNFVAKLYQSYLRQSQRRKSA